MPNRDSSSPFGPNLFRSSGRNTLTIDYDINEFEYIFKYLQIIYKHLLYSCILINYLSRFLVSNYSNIKKTLYVT